jgi:hypothetical protein
LTFEKQVYNPSITHKERNIMTFLSIIIFLNFLVCVFMTLIWAKKDIFNVIIKFIFLVLSVFNAIILYRLFFVGQI